MIDVLKENDRLMSCGKITHSYAHCWRTKTPLIYRATPQWFVSMSENGLLDKAREAVKSVAWHPDWGQARIEGMLDNSPDWCISRQRTWGVPIALFVHKQTGALHPETSVLIEQVALRIEEGGMDAWYDLDAEELLGADAADYQKVTDTLDVWFDSGVTHAAVLGPREELHYPADLYLEGSDQHRGWFQSSLKTAIAINGSAPYKAVLTHGFTVDEHGRKMSKSVGNVVAPQKVINEMGADVLRLWISSADFSGEMAVSDEILKRAADSYRRVRNTARYFLSNLDGFEPQQHSVVHEDLLVLDRWAVDCAARLQDEIVEAYKNYQFHHIYQKLHNFCVTDMGGFYLDIIKDRIYTCRNESLPRRSAQTALFHIAEAFVRWIAPILSFTAHEIWGYMPGKRDDSVFLAELYELPKIDWSKEAISKDDWNEIANVKEAVNGKLEQLRKEGVVGGSLEASVTIFANASTKRILDKLGDELRFVLITSAVKTELYEGGGSEGDVSTHTGVHIDVIKAEGQKCARCWHFREDVGSNSEHPEICGRCVENVEGSGESRQYA